MVCALRGPDEGEVVAGLATASSVVRVVRRCADLAEALAVVSAGSGEVVLLSSDLPDIDRETVAGFHGAGVPVAVLVQDAAVEQRLHALGVDAVLAPDLTADAVAVRLAALGRQTGPDRGEGGPAPEGAPRRGRAHLTDDGSLGRRDDGSPARRDDGSPGPRGHSPFGRRDEGGPGSPDEASCDLGDALSTPVTSPALDDVDRGDVELGGVSDPPGGDANPPGGDANPPGVLVVVWGPPGSPGRSTVAVNLAAELSGLGLPFAPRSRRRPWSRRRAGGSARSRRRAGRSVLLVDADTHAPSLAQLLGLLDESAGIAGAVRAAGHGTLDVPTLGRIAPPVLPGLRVLTGLTRADRWPELPAPSLESLWEVCRRTAEVTVVDCASPLERDEALSYDTRAPQRNAATVSALQAADVVVVVGGAGPVGLQRLVRGLGELEDSLLAVSARRHVVVNRVRAGVAGPRPAAAVRDALARYAGVDAVLLIGEDAGLADTALLQGRAWAELTAASPARGDLLGLVEHIEHELSSARSRAEAVAGA